MSATSDPGRDAYIAGLRRLADALEQHPDLPLPYTGADASLNFHFVTEPGGGRHAMDEVTRLIGASWGPDEMYGDDPVYIKREGRLDGLLIGLIRYAGPEDRQDVTP